MKVRKLLSMIVTSAFLVSTITVPTTNATTTLSVQKADSVFAADTEASPAITTTKITTMANVVKTTTTTTLPSITSTTSSHFSSVFKKVINYPEKTVYNKGEKLDIKGLLISATVNSNSFDDAAEKQYDESYFKIGNFTVIDKEGSAVSGNRFSTLPAGEYTVSHHGLIGDYYSYNGCNDVVFSYNVTIIDDSPNATKTNPVTTTITTTTTTTLTTTMVMPTTHKTYVFDKVLYYPEKTVYNTGEELNIKRLLIRATENPKNNPNNNTSRQYDESYFSISSFNVTDKNEKSVSGSKFNTLPAGDYTVSYDGTVGNYYDFNWCTNVKFSYNVTINDDVQNSTTTTTTEEPVMWMYGTGVDQFDGIKTLPTKTIYNEGEDFDLSGLVITAHHSVSRHNNKGQSEVMRTDYVWEVENIASENITISDLSGKTYTVDEFTKLRGDSAYIVKIGKSGYSYIKLNIRGNEYERVLYGDFGLTFRVYINQPDNASQFIRIDNAEVESFEYGTSNYGFKLKGMDALRIDMDAHMHTEYEIEDIRKGDVVSGALKIDSKNNYVILGDLKIVKYGGESGDANCDNTLSMADAVLIMQALANPNKYGIDGTDGRHMTKRGESIADMNGDGITVLDAQLIQNKLLGL